jgi:hypothetical protein
MIDSRVLVFPHQRPDPSLPHWIARIEAVGRAARRERALPLGLGIAALGVALFCGRISVGPKEALPGWLPRGLLDVADQCPETLLLIGLVLLVGGVLALGFWHSIGRWSAAYRLPAALYGRYEVRGARVASLGFRVRMGEKAQPYRRIRWHLVGSRFTGWSPPVLAEYAEVLNPGDTVWIGVDREKTLPPIFLGIDQ